MCCDGWNYYEDGDEPDGECPDCGGPTLEGSAMEGCNYSPRQCETCGDSPCDQSC